MGSNVRPALLAGFIALGGLQQENRRILQRFRREGSDGNDASSGHPDRSGNRGYRAAQLEAAIVAGKLYLAAYALRTGATGLTFFDDEVTTFFSPHATGKSVMFLIALGHPHKKGG